ncbi:MAG: ABC transporter ATP-binding protein [Kordiimonadaceae bacterium]|nr:ABC transporter ATP-binding protein [Kordiimonadaceae bacterium]MBO6567267.1 ABC transporter ATP-binding protein [Kordiimonadaceae bacterium]MBO6963519.1 ABC transporter ATP-binding protein [Kordiimonadaceae bacterium]
MSLTDEFTSGQQAMLQTTNLRKTFDGVVALEGLNISVKPGETLCLLGANGAGKTTTINLLLGFLEPTSGEAFVNGRNVAEEPVETKRDLAYIPEQVALYPSLSGLENLKYFAALAGQDSYSDADLYAFIERSGLSKEQADRSVSAYSKGMRQKIGVATALAKQAKAFLLDEPLSGLDPSAANEFARLAGELRASGAAILMATHDIFRATELASRIGIMKAGQLVEELDPQALHGKEIEAIYLNHMRTDHAAPAKGAAA